MEKSRNRKVEKSKKPKPEISKNWRIENLKIEKSSSREIYWELIESSKNWDWKTEKSKNLKFKKSKNWTIEKLNNPKS